MKETCRLGELLNVEKNEIMQQPKTFILIDGCLSDIEEARQDSFTEEVYNSQQLFGGFSVRDSKNEVALKCKAIAETCRNNGKSYDEMLNDIHKEAMRLIAAQELNRLNQDKKIGLDFVSELNGKYYIMLDKCIEKIDIAKKNIFLNSVYCEESMFHGFGASNPLNYNKIHISFAQECRNKGLPFAEMLDQLNLLYQEELVREREAETIKKQQEIKERKKRNIIIYTTMAIIIFCVIGFAWHHHIETVRYNEEYARVEQLMIQAEYERQKRVYDRAVKAENEKTETDISVTVSNDLDYNNSVGNDWYYEFYINDIYIDPFDDNIIHAKFGDTFTIASYYVEDDSWPDSGYSKSKVNLTKEQLLKGYTITQETIIRENHGRYTGNTAKWITTYKLTAIMNYPKRPNLDEITFSEAAVVENMWK